MMTQDNKIIQPRVRLETKINQQTLAISTKGRLNTQEQSVI